MQEVKPNKKPLLFYWLIALLILFTLNTFVFPSALKSQVQDVDYGTFMDMMNEKEIGSVMVNTDEIVFTDKSGDNVYSTGNLNDPQLVDRLYESGAEFDKEVVNEMNPILYYLISLIIPIALMIFVSRWLSKKMGNNPTMMQFGMGSGSNAAKVYVKSDNGIKFSDVAGEEEAKELLQEIVEYLHEPKRYTEIGATLPKGALLVGPPGTGKTLLAKAVAGEANVPFFSISGSEFVQMFVGMGAAKVRDLFKQAKEKAPCIVFIDEIDTIGKKRDGQIGGNDEREQTLNALLAEMDGFDTSKGILILAATNRPEVLDPALLRPGRFDRRIIVDAPDFKGRLETLRVHSKDVKLDETVDLDAIANITSGAVGSDLANMVNEAAINAVKCGRRAISQADLMEAVEVVIAGKEKKDSFLP